MVKGLNICLCNRRGLKPPTDYIYLKIKEPSFTQVYQETKKDQDY